LGGLSTAVSPNTPAGERGAVVALALAVATATVVAFFLRTTCRRTRQYSCGSSEQAVNHRGLVQYIVL